MLRQSIISSASIVNTCFIGRYDAARSDWTVKLIAASSVRAVNSEQELIVGRPDKNVLLLCGVFDWSNYSQNTIHGIIQHQDAFINAGIDVAIFHAANEKVVASACPACVSVLHTAVAEPILFILGGNRLCASRAGHASAADILSWIKLSISLTPP